jgi:hypothetical protein
LWESKDRVLASATVFLYTVFVFFKTRKWRMSKASRIHAYIVVRHHAAGFLDSKSNQHKIKSLVSTNMLRITADDTKKRRWFKLSHNTSLLLTEIYGVSYGAFVLSSAAQIQLQCEQAQYVGQKGMIDGVFYSNFTSFSAYYHNNVYPRFGGFCLSAATTPASISIAIAVLSMWFYAIISAAEPTAINLLAKVWCVIIPFIGFASLGSTVPFFFGKFK